MKQIQALQSQSNSLAANNKFINSEQKLKDYEARVESMQGTLMQSSTALKLELKEKKGMIASLTQERDASVKQAEELKLELVVLESKVNDVRSLEASLKMQISDLLFEQQWSEIDTLKTKLGDEPRTIKSIEWHFLDGEGEREGNSITKCGYGQTPHYVR